MNIARSKATWIAVAVAVALLVATAIAALLAATRRTREGFAFRGEVSKMTAKHAKHVFTKCATGTSWEELTSNDAWSFLGKYKEEDVKHACDLGHEFIRIWSDPTKKYWNLMINQARCKHGMCPNKTLRTVRPCLNKTGSKCCAWNPVLERVTSCVPADSADDAWIREVTNPPAGPALYTNHEPYM